MEQEAIHNYLERYFLANHCDILDKKEGYLKVKLTVEVDKLLINRPFYWHYIEKINGEPETKTLEFKTRQEEELPGEFIHFGSPRLHQIFQSTRALSSYIRLYQDLDIGQKGSFTSLAPWLGVNFKISYQSHLKKDYILSLGLHLIKGTIISDFHNFLTDVDLTPKIPNYCYTLAPMIKPISGLKRLEAVIEKQIQEDQHDWAERAKQRWNDDQQLLDQFYEDPTEQQNDEAYLQETEALRNQYEPQILVDVINGGLFYLQDELFQQ